MNTLIKNETIKEITDYEFIQLFGKEEFQRLQKTKGKVTFAYERWIKCQGWIAYATNKFCVFGDNSQRTDEKIFHKGNYMSCKDMQKKMNESANNEWEEVGVSPVYSSLTYA